MADAQRRSQAAEADLVLSLFAHHVQACTGHAPAHLEQFIIGELGSWHELIKRRLINNVKV